MFSTTSGDDRDEVLVQRAAAGSHPAFAELVRRHHRGLSALALRLLGDRERADDAVQEAYLKAFRALPRFRAESGVRTWLYRITYNACLDEVRRRPPGTDTLPDEDKTATMSVSDQTDGVVARSCVASALARLAPELRGTLVLVEGYGFDYRGAASVLGVPPGTVGSRLNRARASLRAAGREDDLAA